MMIKPQDSFPSDENRMNNNQQLLKQNAKTIRKQVSECLSNFGFYNKGSSLFSRFREDIVEYFAIDHPPGSLYFHYC